MDLGCGDFRCGEAIYGDLDILYNGYDAYSRLIELHQNTYTKYNFKHLDFLNAKTEIQSADLCILKDVLQHWSLEEIYTFLDYLIEAKLFRYILIINCSDQTSDYIDDCKTSTGGWNQLSANFLPLRKYNPIILNKYDTKEISLITTNYEPKM